MLADHRRDHRHHFLEHLAPFLDEQFVRRADRLGGGAVEEAEIVADIVGEHCLEPRSNDLPVRAGCKVLGLDQHRGGDIAEDEMAVAVAHVVVAGADLRADHQHRTGIARTDEIGSSLDTESGRGTGDVHVKPEAFDPQRILYLDRHRRIGTLHVRGGAEHCIDIGCVAPGARQRIERGFHAHPGQHRKFVVAALGPARGHHFGIEQRRLAHHVPRLDPARLLDEFDRAGLQFEHVARGDLGRMIGVEPRNVSVEAGDQFFVADRFRRGEEPGRRDDGDDFAHDAVS